MCVPCEQGKRWTEERDPGSESGFSCPGAACLPGLFLYWTQRGWVVIAIWLSTVSRARPRPKFCGLGGGGPGGCGLLGLVGQGRVVVTPLSGCIAGPQVHGMRARDRHVHAHTCPISHSVAYNVLIHAYKCTICAYTCISTYIMYHVVFHVQSCDALWRKLPRPSSSSKIDDSILCTRIKCRSRSGLPLHASQSRPLRSLNKNTDYDKNWWIRGEGTPLCFQQPTPHPLIELLNAISLFFLPFLSFFYSSSLYNESSWPDFRSHSFVRPVPFFSATSSSVFLTSARDTLSRNW